MREIETSNPQKGPDGVPCTADDPFPGVGIEFGMGAYKGLLSIEVLTRLTTGVAGGEVLDVNADPGIRLGAGEGCSSGACET